MAIVDLVARVDDTDPLELAPLYRAIDPDQLDAICDPTSGFQELTFEYEGRTVVVEAIDDTIEISLADVPRSTTDADGLADVGSS